MSFIQFSEAKNLRGPDTVFVCEQSEFFFKIERERGYNKTTQREHKKNAALICYVKTKRGREGEREQRF